MDNLIVKANNPWLKDEFCSYLIDEIKSEIIIKLFYKNTSIKKQIPKFEKFINSPLSEMLKDCYGKKKLNLNDILVQGIENICFLKYGNVYKIQVNPLILIPGTFIPVSKICNLVDRGNTDLQGTYLFSDTYKSIQNNFGRYIDMYLSGV